MPAPATTAYTEHIRQVFAGTGKGVPTDAQIGAALRHLPPQATPQGLAAFLRGKLPSVRHAGALVRLAQEHAHELHYRPAAAVFQCVKCPERGLMIARGRAADAPRGLGP